MRIFITIQNDPVDGATSILEGIRALVGEENVIDAGADGLSEDG